MANKRICLLCRQEYEYCGHCGESKKMPTWYNLFHNENCHQIWYALSDFSDGSISKEEAQEKLSTLDTTVIKNESALRSYRKLFDIKEPVVEETPAVENVATEETAPVEEEVAPAEEKIEDEDVVVIEGPIEEKEEEEEVLSVSQELKKHNNRHNKYNKKN